jgi:hypothetical protein
MTKGTTVRCMAVVAGVLLATVASVYADHAATGKGTYAVSQLDLAEFRFVVAKPVAMPGPDPDLEPGLNFVQSEMAGKDDSTPFQTFMISTAIAPFNITTDESDRRTVTIKGQMVSTTFLGAGPEPQSSAELVSFTAIGVDARDPNPGTDFFTLEVTYSASQMQGPLFASFDELGNCDATTCTIKFEGRVIRGDIFVHTSGDE